jgi:transposase
VELLHERCAGLDIGKKDLKACVRTPSPSGRRSRRQEIRTFATTTKGLLELREWLVAQKVTLVVLEATGDYWRGAFYLLEDCLNVILVNAAHAKGLPGRKTDVCDAAWLTQRGECGLLKASFVPPEPIRQLRDLTRYRATLAAERTREASRLEKELEDAPLTELSGRSFVSERRVAGCVVTVRPRDWCRGCTAGSGVAGRAAVRLGGGDR